MAADGDLRRLVVPLLGETLEPIDAEGPAPAPRWPIAWFAFAAVFALTGATALVLPHVAPVFGPRAAPSATRAAVACVPDPRDPGYCDRYVTNVAGRSYVSLDEARARQPDTAQIEHAVLNARPGPGQSPVDALRASLTAYPGAVVRPSRPDDPAPAGTVIFAVPFGPDCVLGYTSDTPADTSTTLVGRLPEGGCLSP